MKLRHWSKFRIKMAEREDHSDRRNKFLDREGNEILLKDINEHWKKMSKPSSKRFTKETNEKDSYDAIKIKLIFEGKIPSKGCDKPSSVNVHSDLDLLLKNVSQHKFISYDLDINSAKKDIIKLLKEEYVFFMSAGKKNLRLQTIVLFKLVEKIFSSAEICHPIVTCTLTFMAEILTSKLCISFINIAERFAIIDIALNIVSLSKAFMPEALCFLESILLLALSEANKSSFNLIVKEKILSEKIPTFQLHPPTSPLSEEEEKVVVISTIASQVSHFATLYEGYPSFRVIFERFLNIFTKLPTHLYPPELEADIKKLIVSLGQAFPKLKNLSYPITRPKLLKTFEPLFDCKYEPLDVSEHKCKSDAAKKRMKSITQKIKKEERNLLRDIRKTAKVAAAFRLNEKQEQDKERRIKTKRIYSELAAQAGEYKKMKRM